MSRIFMDYDDGDIGYVLDDNMAMDSKGNFIQRLDNNTVLDMGSGEVHFISGWGSREESYGFGGSFDDFDLDD